MFYDFAATAVEDKRSCLNNRIGKQLFGKNISISDDVFHPRQKGAPFDGEGMPRQKVLLVDRGVPKNLVYSRASATIARKKPTGHGFALPNEYGEAPMNLVFSGGSPYSFGNANPRSEEHTPELPSQSNLVCRLPLEQTNTPQP